MLVSSNSTFGEIFAFREKLEFLRVSLRSFLPSISFFLWYQCVTFYVCIYAFRKREYLRIIDYWSEEARFRVMKKEIWKKLTTAMSRILRHGCNSMRRSFILLVGFSVELPGSRCAWHLVPRKIKLCFHNFVRIRVPWGESTRARIFDREGDEEKRVGAQRLNPKVDSTPKSNYLLGLRV